VSDIFISYAREDRDLAERLANALASTQLTVWWDANNRGGEDWLENISRELDSAKCVLALWSKSSVASRFVKAESLAGYKRNVLIPVLLE
jgi:hypothetical protein